MEPSCRAMALFIYINSLHHDYHQNNHSKIQLPSTDVPPAPLAIVEMVRCQCKAHCTTHVRAEETT